MIHIYGLDTFMQTFQRGWISNMDRNTNLHPKKGSAEPFLAIIGSSANKESGRRQIISEINYVLQSSMSLLPEITVKI